MRSPGLLAALPLLLLSLAACDSSTDLAEETLDGRWEGVGPIQNTAQGLRVRLTEAPDGTLSGTWNLPGQPLNPVQNGSHEDGVVQFTLLGFLGGSHTFEGTLTDRFRLEGTMNGLELDGPAVFRRASFSPDD